MNGRYFSKVAGRRAPWLVAFVLGIGASGCGGASPTQTSPVQKETAESEIRRVGGKWAVTQGAQRLLSPPSPLSRERVKRQSELEFKDGQVQEHLWIEEEVQLRSGQLLNCKTEFQLRLESRFGRREGEAAVELLRPALVAERACSGGQHPEPQFREAATRVLFVLRDDRLVAVEPRTDGRSYTPSLE